MTSQDTAFRSCSQCGGEMFALGILATTVHFRCRGCGWMESQECPELVEPEGCGHCGEDYDQEDEHISTEGVALCEPCGLKDADAHTAKYANPGGPTDA